MFLALRGSFSLDADAVAEDAAVSSSSLSIGVPVKPIIEANGFVVLDLLRICGFCLRPQSDPIKRTHAPGEGLQNIAICTGPMYRRAESMIWHKNMGSKLLLRRVLVTAEKSWSDVLVMPRFHVAGESQAESQLSFVLRARNSTAACLPSTDDDDNVQCGGCLSIRKR